MTFTVRPARYAKGKLAVVLSDDGGYKTRAAHMIEALGGRYVGRERAYLASPKQVADLELLLAAGWSGDAGLYRGTAPIFRHPDRAGNYDRKTAVDLARGK